MRNNRWRNAYPIDSMGKKVIVGVIGAEASDGQMLESHVWLAGQNLDGIKISLSAFSLAVFDRDYSKACPSNPR